MSEDEKEPPEIGEKDIPLKVEVVSAPKEKPINDYVDDEELDELFISVDEIDEFEKDGV